MEERTVKALIFSALISANAVIWYAAVGMWFLVVLAVMITVLVLVLRKK